MDASKRHKGRPRVYPTNAERQRAYRKSQKTTRPPTTDDPLLWNSYLVKLGLSVNAGLFIDDAPQGVGLQHSGGNDHQNLDWMDVKHNDIGPCGGGRRVRPRGAGSNDRVPRGTPPELDSENVLLREIEALENEEALRKSSLMAKNSQEYKDLKDK